MKIKTKMIELLKEEKTTLSLMNEVLIRLYLNMNIIKRFSVNKLLFIKQE